MPVETGYSSNRRIIQDVLRALNRPATHLSTAGCLDRSAGTLYELFEQHEMRTRLVTSPSSSPMIVAGNGPVLLLTYLDDTGLPSLATPANQETSTDPGGIPSNRRQRAIAAAAANLIDPALPPGMLTLIVETDRHSGSLTLESWLAQSTVRYQSALWEAPDLPIRSPAVVHSACGTLAVRLSITSKTAGVETLFSGVVPDIAGMVIKALADLTPSDQVVMVDGFYDGVSAPDEESLRAVYSIAPDVDQWLRETNANMGSLPPSHVAMGLFFAPSISIRSIRMVDHHPLLPAALEVVIECKLVPGQSTASVLDKLAAYLAKRIDRAAISITTLLAREPVSGRSNLSLLRSRYPDVLPVTPGYTPAGLLEAHGIPSIGYMTASYQSDLATDREPYGDIEAGSELIQSLINRMYQSARPS